MKSFQNLHLLWIFVLLMPGVQKATGQGNPAHVEFNGHSFQMPIPQGYEPLPREGEQIRRITSASVGTNGVVLAMYLSHQDAQMIRSGSTSEDKQRFLAVIGDRRQMEIIRNDQQFSKLKSIVLAQQADMAKQIKGSLKKYEGAANERLKNALSYDAGMQIGNTTIYPIHDESERHWSGSLSINMQLTDEAGKRHSLTNTVTTAHLFFRPGMLQLVASSVPGDLDWSRQVIGEWVEAVKAANPLPVQLSATPVVSGGASSEVTIEKVDGMYRDAKTQFLQWVGLFVILALVAAVKFFIQRRKQDAPKPPPLKVS